MAAPLLDRRLIGVGAAGLALIWLRTQFAALYPGFEPGVWQDAAALAEQMLTEHLLQPSPGYMLSDRVLAKSASSSGVGTTVTGRGLGGWYKMGVFVVGAWWLWGWAGHWEFRDDRPYARAPVSPNK